MGSGCQKRIQYFFKQDQLSDILRKNNAYKQQGVSVIAIVSYLFCLVFRNRSMVLDMQSGKARTFGKGIVYRFKSTSHINGIQFTTLLSARIIETTVEPLRSDKRRNAFVIDDTIFEKLQLFLTKLLGAFNSSKQDIYALTMES